MKKVALAVITAVLIIASALVAFAGEYSIYDHYWDSNFNNGTVRIRWDKCDSSTKYQVIVFRKALNSSKSGFGTQVQKKTVSGSSFDVTDLICNKGTGLYSYSITPTKSPYPLDDMVVSDEEFEADEDFVKRARGRYTDLGGTVVQSSGWAQIPNGWIYIENGNRVTNAWRSLGGFWYYFDANGTMVTNWRWIGGKCYYFNTVNGQGGRPLGACWIGGVTPDGYTVNGNGEWTVNNVVQHQ